MDYIIEQIRKMLNSLPNSDKRQEVERNLIDMAEDKYYALIDDGIEEEKACQLVIESVCSVNDIRDALGIDKRESEYMENKAAKSKQLSKFIVLFFALPVAFLFISDNVKNEMVRNIAFSVVVTGMIYAAINICLLIIARGKSKKDIENKFDRKTRLLRNIILTVVFIAVIICIILDAPEYAVFLSIGLGFVAYYAIKYFLQKNN